MNQVKTAMLLATMTALFLFVGHALGGRSGLVLAAIMAGIMNFTSYWWSDKIVLKTYGAREVGPDQAPDLFRIVRELTVRDNIPMPRVYIVPDQSPNAFATGRNPQHAAVAVTEGIMRLLDQEELKGVLGHELSHVKHRDTLITTVAATLAGALGMLSNMAMWGGMARGGSRDDRRGNPLLGMLAIMVAPLAAAVIRMAISRGREYSADESGAEVSGNPMALASALAKIEQWSQRVPMSVGSPTTAHLFIINPFTGGMAQLFSTHPPTAARIQRLRAIAERMGGGGRSRVA